MRTDDGAAIAGALVTELGGRYSIELGIDVDAGDSEVERWFVAATLFGARISAGIAARTFGVLDRAGVSSIHRAGTVPWERLVSLLDSGGYARYDFSTATRLQRLAGVIDRDHGGEVASIGRRWRSYTDLCNALDALPGWGPVTVGLFLRELRGVWPGAQPPLDPRALERALELGLIPDRSRTRPITALRRIADYAGLDVRDVESALVRAALRGGRRRG